MSLSPLSPAAEAASSGAELEGLALLDALSPAGEALAVSLGSAIDARLALIESELWPAHATALTASTNVTSAIVSDASFMMDGYQSRSAWSCMICSASRPGAPGVPKAKELRSEAAASAYLETQRGKKLAEGYVVVDEEAGLTGPFTLDGQPKKRVVPQRFAWAADQIRLFVRGGFCDREDLEKIIDDLIRQSHVKDHAQKSDAHKTIEERFRDIEIAARVAQRGEVEEPSTGGYLRDLFDEVSQDERAAQRARVKPSPCINDAIDAAFAALGTIGIIALQSVGFTQSDGWDDANQAAEVERKRGHAPVGACFYNSQDLERAVAGNGLALTFGPYISRDVDHQTAALMLGRAITSVLREHGVPAQWDDDPQKRIQVDAFEWYRMPR